MGCMGTQDSGDFCGRDIDSTSTARFNDRGAHPGNVTAYRISTTQHNAWYRKGDRFAATCVGDGHVKCSLREWRTGPTQ
eukprot:9494611-Pyramimonas_sp.AAC.1